MSICSGYNKIFKKRKKIILDMSFEWNCLLINDKISPKIKKDILILSSAALVICLKLVRTSLSESQLFTYMYNI